MARIIGGFGLAVLFLACFDPAAAPAQAAPLCPWQMREILHLPVPRHTRAHKGSVPPHHSVGDHRQFWTWEFSVMPPTFRRVDTTCRAAGQHCLIYVEDSEWGSVVNEDQVAKIFDRYEHHTPAGSVDTERGIGAITAQVFGNPPTGLDGEPRVALLLEKMSTFHDQVFDGYFNAFDTLTDAEAQQQDGQRSNEANILYLNTRGAAVDTDYKIGVVAHELQHLIHHRFDTEEVSWLNESLSETSMVVCGYPIDTAHMQKFAQKPETALVTNGYVSYGACFLFGTYLYEQLGTDALGAIVRDTTHGPTGLEKTLEMCHRAGKFGAFLEDWVVANLLAARKDPDPRYAYHSFPVPDMVIRAVPSLPAEDAGKLVEHQWRYLRLPRGNALDLTFALEPADAKARLILISTPPRGKSVVKRLLAGSGSSHIASTEATLDRVLLLHGIQEAGYRLQLSPSAVGKTLAGR
jgi:hypothetical protein